MAVLVDENTKVICQGLTGSQGDAIVYVTDFDVTVANVLKDGARKTRNTAKEASAMRLRLLAAAGVFGLLAACDSPDSIAAAKSKSLEDKSEFYSAEDTAAAARYCLGFVRTGTKSALPTKLGFKETSQNTIRKDYVEWNFVNTNISVSATAEQYSWGNLCRFKSVYLPLGQAKETKAIFERTMTQNGFSVVQESTRNGTVYARGSEQVSVSAFQKGQSPYYGYVTVSMRGSLK